VLTDPPLMFCDEPTSGLDSFMAQNVMLVLKSMALKGKTVVTTIHQPSSEIFAMFDKVLLMAEGRVAFLGSPDDACKFFRA
jgi:ABC-type multidrug transport system ATPase subunit